MNRSYAAFAGVATGVAAVAIAAGTGMLKDPFSTRDSAIATAAKAQVPQIAEPRGAVPPPNEGVELAQDAAPDEVAEAQWRAALEARLAEAEAREQSLKTEKEWLEDQVSRLAELEQSLRDRTEALSAEAEALLDRRMAIETREADLESRQEDLDLRLAAVPAPQEPEPQLSTAEQVQSAPRETDAVSAEDGGAQGAEAASAGESVAPKDNDRKHRTFADGPITEVHFELNSAQLTPGAMQRAQEAARRVMGMNVAKIRIIGFTDRSGSLSYNRALSQARAEAVADVFVQSGLSRDVIEVSGMGEAQHLLPISTADGISEPLNRCVGILVEEVAPL